MTSRDKIKVVCRIRPENALEKSVNYNKCVTYQDYNITVAVSINSEVINIGWRRYQVE
jgi:hypothetical protein